MFSILESFDSKKLKCSIESAVFYILASLIFIIKPLFLFFSEWIDRGKFPKVEWGKSVFNFFFEFIFMFFCIIVVCIIDQMKNKNSVWLTKFITAVNLFSLFCFIILTPALFFQKAELGVAFIANLAPVPMLLIIFYKFHYFFNSLISDSFEKVKRSRGNIHILCGLFLIVALVIADFYCIKSFFSFFSAIYKNENITDFVWIKCFFEEIWNFISGIFKDFSFEYKNLLKFLTPLKDNSQYLTEFKRVIKECTVSTLFLFIFGWICGNGFFHMISGFIHIINLILKKIFYFFSKIIQMIFNANQPLQLSNTICEYHFCPFCGEKSYSFKSYNFENYNKYKVVNEYPGLLEKAILLSERKYNNVYYKENIDGNYEFKRLNNEEVVTVKKGELVGYILGLDQIVKKTILKFQMGFIDNLNYISILKKNVLINIENNKKAPFLNDYFFICSTCGMETPPQKTKIVNFIGSKDSAKTTLIYKLMTYPSVKLLGNSNSFDSRYWKNIKDEGDKKNIVSTSVIKSPGLSLKIGRRKYTLFDIQGEIIGKYNMYGFSETDKSLFICSDSILIFTVSLDLSDNIINTQKLLDDISQIENVLRDIKNSNLKDIVYYLVFTKADNIENENARECFYNNQCIQQKIRNILREIGQRQIIMTDPQPKQYTESKYFDKFVKQIFN